MAFVKILRLHSLRRFLVSDKKSFGVESRFSSPRVIWLRRRSRIKDKVQKEKSIIYQPTSKTNQNHFFKTCFYNPKFFGTLFVFDWWKESLNADTTFHSRDGPIKEVTLEWSLLLLKQSFALFNCAVMLFLVRPFHIPANKIIARLKKAVGIIGRE